MIPILPAIAGNVARIGLTASSAKSFGGQVAQSFPFGVGYASGTYVGFPGNYQSKQGLSRAKTYYSSSAIIDMLKTILDGFRQLYLKDSNLNGLMDYLTINSPMPIRITVV